MKPDCKCGHPFAAHVETLFGPKCEGRFWHDQWSYQCECKGYVAALKDAEAAIEW